MAISNLLTYSLKCSGACAWVCRNEDRFCGHDDNIVKEMEKSQRARLLFLPELPTLDFPRNGFSPNALILHSDIIQR